MGIGTRMSDAVAKIHLDNGYRYFSKTSHPRFGSYRDSTGTSAGAGAGAGAGRGASSANATAGSGLRVLPLWRSVERRNGPEVKYDFQGRNLARSRVCYSHEYDGGYEPCVVALARAAAAKTNTNTKKKKVGKAQQQQQQQQPVSGKRSAKGGNNSNKSTNKAQQTQQQQQQTQQQQPFAARPVPWRALHYGFDTRAQESAANRAKHGCSDTVRHGIAKITWRGGAWRCMACAMPPSYR